MLSGWMKNGRISYIIAILIGAISSAIATAYFFPLKKLTHWDEVVRYLYPGVDQLHYTPGEVFAALGGHPDNGQVIVFLLRAIRNIFPHDHAMALIVYKVMLLLLTVLVIVWFVRDVFGERSGSAAVFVVCAFLLAPMTWVQANEIMAEPMVLPVGLIYLALSTRFLKWSELSVKGKWSLMVQFIACNYIFLLTSYQCIVQCYVSIVIGLFLFFVVKKAGFRSGFSRTAVIAVLLLCGTALAVPFWVVTHWGTPFLEQIYFYLRPIAVSFQKWQFTGVNMRTFDNYIFGLRNFAWLYFPALLLVIPAAWYIVRKFKALSDSAQLIIVIVSVTVLLSAYAYNGNLMPRYHHLANTLFLIVVLFGLFKFLTDLYQNRKVVYIMFVLLMIGYGVFEYYPLFQVLPSLANMQVYGVYQKDKADCDDVSSFFSLTKKRNFVTFPQLKYGYYYPNRNAGQPQVHFSAVIEKLKDAFMPGMYPSVLDEIIFYNQKSAILQYLEKYGSYPPEPAPGEDVLYIDISIPKTSEYYSVYYSEWGGSSEEKALKLWQEKVANRKHRVVFEGRTKDYTLLAAKAKYIETENTKVDWSNFDSVRLWIIDRIDKYNNLGWIGNVVKKVLNNPKWRS